MSSYDYTFKILLLGEYPEGKAYLASRFCNNLFSSDTKLTIGVDFHVKSIRVLDKAIKLQIWDFGGEERFRFLLPTYCLGANAAFFLYDVSNSVSLDHLHEWTQIIRERAGDIPIVLIGSKLHSEESRAVSREERILVAENYNLSAFAEITSETGQDVEQIFKVLSEILVERYTQNRIEISNHPEISKFTPRKRPEFKVNDYLKLRLELCRTNIYVGKRLFNQCKYLLLNIPTDNIRDYDEIESIDEAAGKFDSSLERGRLSKYYISPETEFWGHCSNLQAWYENNYDTRILHRNLAFPLLKALVNVGDPLAKTVFKEEIAQRLESGYPSVVLHLINQDYLKYLNREELNTILKNPKFIKNLPKWFNKFDDIPKWLIDKIKRNLKNLKCPYCKSKVTKVLIHKFLEGKSIRCQYCTTRIFKEELV